MAAPSVTEAYAMIRVLKKRAAKGDGETIAELQKIIDEDRHKKALLDLDKFFPAKK